MQRLKRYNRRMKSKKNSSSTIALNKKARHEYFLEDKFEAGIELQGWEVKSIRAGKVNIADSYILLRNGEAFLIGSRIQPLNSASSHVVCDPERTRKLLMKKRELSTLIGKSEREGYSIVATAMYWKKCWVKLEIYLAKGKKSHDKRDTIKDRDWARQKERMLKHEVR
ncbi:MULTISPECIES: SsrA-binding protein SmpB [Gammaproteobacteria]|uniref:SsrA-binding protein SmpB n=2 Tax=Gammaproteobacteria TaxID=1236 RepID=UPI000DD0E22C|nr:SsrA-binding protein SmpB [Aliidiomarina sp. B3213]TCZ93421.1 SsrA-binding protein SmpB [Lysobacter sp. N42]